MKRLRQTPEELLLRIHGDLKRMRINSSPLGLLEGDMGRLLFLIEYARFTGNKKEISSIKKDISRAFAQLELFVHDTSFASGILGFLAFLNYYNIHSGENLELDQDTADTLHHLVNTHLTNELQHRGNYEYMAGAVAGGHYWLDQDKTSPVIGQLISFFDSAKTVTPQGICWYEPEGIYELNKRTGTYNLGTAHGILPVILFLAKCVNAGIEADRCRLLVNESIRFIENNRLKEAGAAFMYPAFVENGRHKTSRHGWCYGDLGIAMLYLQCAELVQDDALKNRARDIALFSAKLKNVRTARTEDAAICHGTGGLYLQYLILGRHFRNPDITETAQYWKNKTIAYSKYNEGPGGYMVPTLAGMQGNPGFLGGAAGIGLCFLYELNNGNAPWLKFLLLAN